MKKLYYFILSVTIIGLSSCKNQNDEDFKNQLVRVMKENPEVLEEIILNNPIKFMEAAKVAAKKHKIGQIKDYNQKIDEELKLVLDNPIQEMFEDERRVFGPKDAPIEIISYDNPVDPQSRWFGMLKREIIKKYPGKVKISQRHLVVGSHTEISMKASSYFEVIKKFRPQQAWDFYNKMINSQKKLISDKESHLDGLLKELNITNIPIGKNIQDLSKIVKNDTLRAKKFGKDNHPLMIINGVAIRGPKKMEFVDKVIKNLQDRKILIL